MRKLYWNYRSIRCIRTDNFPAERGPFMNTYRAGIDIGSTTVKLVLLDEEGKLLFGEYRRLKGAWENGVLTGKGFSYGGSLIRPEATGYGAVYYLQNVLEHEGERIAGKTIACAGFGNVTWGICKKATQLGAKVVTLSGPDGYIYDPDGVATEEKIAYLVGSR